VKTHLDAAGEWFKRWWAAFVIVVVTALALFGVWRRREWELGQAKDAAAVAEARRQMDALRAQRLEVTARVDAKSEEIVALDARITESKRRIIDLHEHGPTVPDAQLDDAFASLGY